jgi:formate dehydrogenase maturation protein FdhE
MSGSSARVIIEGERKMEQKVCVFCETLWNYGTIVCPTCKDYKGIMTRSEAESYLGIQFAY